MDAAERCHGPVREITELSPSKWSTIFASGASFFWSLRARVTFHRATRITKETRKRDFAAPVLLCRNFVALPANILDRDSIMCS